MSMQRIYGHRICLVCDKPFDAQKPGQVTCSNKCRKERVRILDRERKIRMRGCFDLDWLNAEYEKMMAAQNEDSQMLVASYFMVLADAKEEIEWLNCRLENALADRNASNEKLANIAHEMKKNAEKEPEIAQNLSEKSNNEQKTGKNAKKYRHICANCGSTFKSTHSEDRYCCDQCAFESAPCGI